MADPRLILDSGGLSALADGEPRAVALFKRATRQKLQVGIPAPVLAETITGQPRDALLHRFIRSPGAIIDTTSEIAREAGVLRYRARLPEKTIDALVVATAARYPGSIVLTSDVRDLTTFASHRHDAALSIRSVNDTTTDGH